MARKIWSAGDQLNAADLNGNFMFGGTGADGALSISSGTTSVSAGSVNIFTKNYTSISITGTSVLAFSNPNTNGTIIILKSQGAVTLTSSATPMINAAGMGAAGGLGGTTGIGSAGSQGFGPLLVTNPGAGGLSGTTAGGALATIAAPLIPIFKYPQVFVGAGGGGGEGNGSAGTGGRGGGALVIECGGTLNFTTANGISVAGIAGGSTAVSSNQGGGGGAAGCCIILYNLLTSASGTVTVTGGAGGTGTGASGVGGGGGANATNTGGSTSSATGGVGGAGQSLVALNADFS